MIYKIAISAAYFFVKKSISAALISWEIAWEIALIFREIAL